MTRQGKKQKSPNILCSIHNMRCLRGLNSSRREFDTQVTTIGLHCLQCMYFSNISFAEFRILIDSMDGDFSAQEPLFRP
jgi:hypothetical protein